jgi:glutaredoxin
MPGAPKYAFSIYGWEGCGYFNKAQALLKQFKTRHNGTTIDVKGVPRPFWQVVISTYAPKGHTTSPLVFCNSKYIGGHDDLVKWLHTK